MNDDEPTILVVDDYEDSRDTLKERLQHEGYRNVMVAENGRDALDQLARHRIDLVLLDVMMPEMNGVQALEHMKSDDALKDIPVIMISAVGETSSVVRCIELGAEDYLPKPYNAVLLKARIGASLEKKRLRDAVSQQLSIIREIFGKYVPASIAEAIVEGKGTLKPTKTVATILFSDIESFTSISENMPPEQVVQMLNEYFPAVIEPIERYGGVVNQFQGDAMLITFNVPLADPMHADKAVKAAREIQESTKGKTFAGVALRTRIGINTGAVIAGNVGSGKRINYTVHGDAVNVAARLEQLNKQHGTLVLVSGTTAELLQESYPLEPIADVPVRGRTQSMQIFELRV